MSGQYLGSTQMPIRQLIPSEQNSAANDGGPKSRNPKAGKGSLRQGNSLGGVHKNVSFGAISSKSPVMAKSFALSNS